MKGKSWELLSEYDGEKEERRVNLKKHTEKIRNLMLREIDKLGGRRSESISIGNGE
jgi:hypothetical protein